MLLPLSGIAIFSLWPLLTLSQCFWPNGDPADSTHKPCANNSGSCCYYIDDNHHDLCYENGFCLSLFWGYIYRGSCTDHNWNSALGCAVDCLNAAPNDSTIVTFCSGVYSCCNSTSQTDSCCVSGSNTVIWNNATLLPRADLAGSIDATTTTVTQTVMQGDSTVSGSLVTSTATVTQNATQGETICSDKEVGLGIGLGIPLGLALVAVLVISRILIRRPKTVSREVPKTIGQTMDQALAPFERPLMVSEPSELDPFVGQRRAAELGVGQSSELASGQY